MKVSLGSRVAYLSFVEKDVEVEKKKRQQHESKGGLQRNGEE